MKPAKLSILLACVALLALVAAGCGGGGDDSTEAKAKKPVQKEAPTKAQLISEGDAICGEVNAAVGAANAAESSELGETEIKVADLYIGMVESIKGLGEPKPAEGYDEFIESAEALSQAEADAKMAAERGETSTSGSATTALEEFQSQAAIYGFGDCSEEASAPVATPDGGEAESEAGGEVEEGGIEVLPEAEEEFVPEEEAAPEIEEEVAPEGGGAGIEEVAPEEGGGTESGGSSGGVGPG